MTNRLIPNNTLENIVIPMITEKDVLAYGDVANDKNPIHFDRNVAQRYGYFHCIAHGMFTAGVSTTIISPWIRSNCVVKQFETNFLSPLMVGDSLQISGNILTNTEQFAHIQLIGINQKGKKIISGEVQIERVGSYDG